MSPEPLQDPTTKQELLEQIDAEYAEFTRMLQVPTVEERAEVWDDGRSFKDLTAHVADWELYALARIQNHTAPTKTESRIVKDEDLDVVNAEIQARYADLTWDEAYGFLEQTHGAMRAYLEGMDEADIFDPARSAYQIGDPEASVYYTILWNTSGHYREHADEIRATTDIR